MKEGILLKRGTLLFSEEPYVATLSNAFRSTHCSYCFAKNKLSKCTACELHRYCNKECQGKDWVDHKYECKIFKSLSLEERFLIDDQLHILLRIIFKLERQSTKNYNPENFISYCNEKIKLAEYKFMNIKAILFEKMFGIKFHLDFIKSLVVKKRLDRLKKLLPEKIWDKYEQMLPHICNKYHDFIPHNPNILMHVGTLISIATKTL
ncbi:unnamed protein product [Gordionus sp. m RMFG-2023]